MSPARALLVLPLLAALLAGCGADPVAERRDAVAAVMEAANDGDADGVRDAADALLATVADQVERQELAGDEAQRLTALAQAVRSGADVIDEDLLERRRAEAEAEAARKELEEAQKRLEEERRKAEEAARQAEQDKGKGEGKGDKDEDKDENDD